MEGNTHFHHHIVGDVNQIGYGTDADSGKRFLHPFRRIADLDATDDAGGIDGTEIRIVHRDQTGDDRGIRIADLRHDQLGIQQRRDVTGNADVGEPVRTVGRHGAIVHNIGIHQFTEGNADFRIGRQDQQTIVVIAQPQFPGGTHHAEGFHTTEFALLDGEGPFPVLEGGPDGRQRNNVPRVTVGGAADDLQHFVPLIHLTDRKVVGVFVGIAGEDLRGNNAFRDAAGLFDPFHFQTRHGQLCRQFVGGQGKINIFFQPVIGNIHSLVPPSLRIDAGNARRYRRTDAGR